MFPPLQKQVRPTTTRRRHKRKGGNAESVSRLKTNVESYESLTTREAWVLVSGLGCMALEGPEVLFAVSTLDGAMWERWWLVIWAGASTSGEWAGGHRGTGDPAGLTLGLRVLLLLVFIFINFNWISIWSAWTVQLKYLPPLCSNLTKSIKHISTFSAFIL